MIDWIDETLKQFKDEKFDPVQFIDDAKKILMPKVRGMMKELKKNGADKDMCLTSMTYIWYLNGIAWGLCVQEAFGEKLDD